ncbi:hypothetical protein [Streptomyces sp. NPDC047028]|uniref:hypothetical protein n=1 Tax=Streptomyces sp. NPDC047028 TaxID=3155793 RepID=UPI0033C6F674
MRIRATVAAVSGALALSAFVVPAAHATGADSAYRAAAAKALSHSASGKTAFTAVTATAPVGPLHVSFSNLKIAKAVKVGTTHQVTTTVSYTLTHGADINIASTDFANGPFIYKGSSTAPSNLLFGYDAAKCTATSATTASCKGPIDIHPSADQADLTNSDAGTWHAGVMALKYSQDNSATMQYGLGTTLVQRFSQLTVNASPEPVVKGKTLTVTGKLSRANWEDNHYHGYTKQPVKLQFRKAGTSTYTTVKTVYTDAYGVAKTTTTAHYDGYWRYSFAGTTTTPAVNATGDYVDVK